MILCTYVEKIGNKKRKKEKIFPVHTMNGKEIGQLMTDIIVEAEGWVCSIKFEEIEQQ